MSALAATMQTMQPRRVTRAWSPVRATYLFVTGQGVQGAGS
jgi:hypothetical protein